MPLTALANSTPPTAAGPPGPMVCLLAENMLLKTFAAELSQHHHGRLEVDPEVANLTLLGAFPLDDLERTLNMVETTLPVKVRRIMPWWIKIEADETSSSEK